MCRGICSSSIGSSQYPQKDNKANVFVFRFRVIGFFIISFQLHYVCASFSFHTSTYATMKNKHQNRNSELHFYWSSVVIDQAVKKNKIEPCLNLSSDSNINEHEESHHSYEELMDINLQTQVNTSVSYNAELDRFVHSSTVNKSSTAYKMLRIRRYLKSIFIPDGVSNDYYDFMIWRIIQRFVGAILHVFGTQSLLLALGGNKKSSLTQAAALNWILKDTLGKLSRLIYGGLASNKLDADAKRWRFRGSLIYAFGNFLEIITYIFPSWFLLLGTVANSFKQISMLTSSATRNTILSNFSARGNIGDITAKGEAQIAVVDLLGIGFGIKLSKLIGIKKFKRIILLYIALQTIELICMYKEISSVVFRRMNFERLWQVTSNYIKTTKVKSPQEIADHERIFFTPDHVSRRSVAYGSLSRTKMNLDELDQIRRIFANEKYLIVIGKNEKRNSFYLNRRSHPMDICHIILHLEATNEDIVKSTLNLALLRAALARNMPKDVNLHDINIRTSEVYDLLAHTKQKCDNCVGHYLSELEESEWQTEFLFGRCSRRSQWSIRSN